MDISELLSVGPRTTMMVVDYQLTSPIDVKVFVALAKTIRPGSLPYFNGKLPKYDIPGHILTMDYAGNYRGIVRPKKSFFKNSVSLDVSCVERNANVKLSPMKIHLCGLTSESMADEVAKYMLSYIRDIQDYLDYGSKNEEAKEKTLIWLREVTEGLPISEKTTTRRGNLVVNVINKYKLVRAVSSKDLLDAPDEKLAKFYLRMLPEMKSHSDFCRMLDWVSDKKWICDDDLDVGEQIVHLKNEGGKLSFSLGVCFIFAKIFQETFPEYGISYDNALKPSSITITFPYLPRENSKVKDRYVQTALLQSSGAFTFSGCGGKEHDEGFTKFLECMQKMKELIPHTAEEQAEYLLKYLS